MKPSNNRDDRGPDRTDVSTGKLSVWKTGSKALIFSSFKNGKNTVLILGSMVVYSPSFVVAFLQIESRD